MFRRFAIIFCLLIFSLFALVSPPKTYALLSQEQSQCLGKELAEYMNEVIDLVQTNNLTNIRLLTPVFNIGSANFPPIYSAMVANGANFADLYGVAANAYNTQGKTITQHIDENMDASPELRGRRVVVTEFGIDPFPLRRSTESVTPAERALLASEIAEMKGNSKYIAATLFSSFGANPGNPDTGFQFNWMTDPQITTACGGSCDKIGINYANFYNDVLDHSRARGLGMRYVTDIAAPDTFVGIKTAIESGLTPILRLGLGETAYGFEDPEVLLIFLKRLNELGSPIYVPAGPNEPESEPWVAPNCGIEIETNPGDGIIEDQCRDTEWNLGDEFHSLRPYPGCPQKPGISNADYYMCGHDLIARSRITLTRGAPLPPGIVEKQCIESGDQIRCDYEIVAPEPGSTATTVGKVGVRVDLTDAQLPIMGLTQKPSGSTVFPDFGRNNIKDLRLQNQISDGQKMNGFVSWYLNGTIAKAEGTLLVNEEDKDYLSKDSQKKVVNYAGPLRKLLPWRIQTGQQIKQIDDSNAEIRHNQIAACVIEADIPGIGGIFGLPIPCYDSEPFKKLFGEIFKNVGEVGGGPLGGIFGGISEKIGKLVGLGIDQLIGDGIIKEKRIEQWTGNNRKPPTEELYPSFKPYDTDYKQWRGEICFGAFEFQGVRIPWRVCGDSPTEPNYWANLFPYIPLSSTEDAAGSVEADTFGTIQTSTEVTLSNVTFVAKKIGDYEYTTDGKYKTLYFPHMEESAQLGTLLQSTFKPTSVEGFDGGVARELFPTGRCEQLESRSGPGDDLIGGGPGDKKDEVGGWLGGGPERAGDIQSIEGDLVYEGSFSCVFESPTSLTNRERQCMTSCRLRGIPAGSTEEDFCRPGCTFSPGNCEVEVTPAVSIFTRVPYAEEVWSRFVNGTMSIFKRMYPKIEENAPIDEIKDIPASTNATYTQEGADEVAAGDPSENRDGKRAQIFFPHIGSIQDYFLQGIQKALRPFDLSEPPAVGNVSTDDATVGAGCKGRTDCRSTVWEGRPVGSWPAPIQTAFRDASAKFNVPVCVLTSIASIEGSRITALTNEQAALITSAWGPDQVNTLKNITVQLPDGGTRSLYDQAYCNANSASAQGMMQMRSGEWSRHQSASGSRYPNPCNARDSIFAAAEFIIKERLPNYGITDFSSTRAYCATGETYSGSCYLENPSGTQNATVNAACRNLGTNYCDFIANHCGRTFPTGVKTCWQLVNPHLAYQGDACFLTQDQLQSRP